MLHRPFQQRSRLEQRTTIRKSARFPVGGVLNVEFIATTRFRSSLRDCARERVQDFRNLGGILVF